MEAIRAGFEVFLGTPMIWAVMVFGIFEGIIFGAIPGLTAVLCVTLMIPFTFNMSAVMGLSLLVAIYVGAISGGLITATLINIPGTPSSLITTWDGYPMANKRGKPAEALSIGVFASLLGGTFSAIVLFGIAPQLAKVALLFGSWEYFAVCLMGLSIVSSTTGEDTVKGLLGAVIGLVLGTVGIDMLTGIQRLTFGSWQLQGGLNATVMMMSFFAIREIMNQVNSLGQREKTVLKKKISFRPPFKEMKGCGPALAIGSLIGTWVGILPGIGQTPATILAYHQVKNISKNPEMFGQGSPEGIAVSESANNACNGGALIPLITLGIPGDGVTIALIGGFMIHGIQPGPLLFTQNLDLVGIIMVVYFISNFVMYFMELGMMKAFIKMVNVPYSLLFPAIIVFCLLGVFALNNRIYDLGILMAFAAFGYILNEFKIDMVSLILGFVLGPMVENHLRRALIASSGSMGDITTRPIAMVFLAVSIVFLFWPFIKKGIQLVIPPKAKAKA
jgi:putative tricarboxylic transport membrane protein